MAIVRRPLCRRFVGRHQELGYLDERRREAGRSRGSLVLVVGEAGIGKSRLVSEFCSRLAGSRLRVGHGACLEHTSRPYGPILDLLAEYEQGSANAAPPSNKREQFDAIVGRLAALGAKNGLVAIIEDVHWADTATLELLAYLAPKLERMRVLVIATFRPDALTSDRPSNATLSKVVRASRTDRIQLEPFDEFELRLFIAEALKEYVLPEETRRVIAATSEGNPFFVEELLQVAVERRSAEGSPPIVKGGLPSSIRATVIERLLLLPEAERRIVVQAAVIGRSFDVDLLVQTLGASVDTVLSALRRAREIQLIDETAASHFRFRHALTREAVYGELLEAQAAPLHRTIALALEGMPAASLAVERLAYHWQASGDNARAAPYNEAAGDAATAVHAHDDAIEYYERALESTQLDPCQRGALIFKVGERRQMLNSVDRACQDFAAAADQYRLGGDDDREAFCRVRSAVSAYMLGLESPTAPLEEMLVRLPAESFLARSRAHLGIAWIAASVWSPSEAARHLAHVDERVVDANPEIALRYRNVGAWVAMTIGDVATFRSEQIAWVAAAERTGLHGTVAAAHYNSAMCLSILGLHQEALEQTDRAISVAQLERNPHGEQSALAVASMAHYLRGDLAGARDVLNRISATSESQITLANAAAWGTLVGLHLDEPELIATWFDGVGVTLFDDPETSCGAGFAEVLMRRGRVDEAADILHKSIPDFERPRGNMLTLIAAARYGSPEVCVRARAQLVAAADSPTDLAERYALMLFDAYRAHRVGDHRSGIAKARDAALGFGRLQFPLLEAAAWEAAAEPEAAAAVYDRCGAVADVRRLTRLVVVPPTRRGKPHTGETDRAPFSEREREVAMLVAAGRSNMEIAGDLDIGKKTVEKHISAVYRKLGVSSRVQLTAHLGSRSDDEPRPETADTSSRERRRADRARSKGAGASSYG